MVKLTSKIAKQEFPFKIGKEKIVATFKQMNTKSYINTQYKLVGIKNPLDQDCVIIDELFISFDKKVKVDGKEIEKFSDILEAPNMEFAALFTLVRNWCIKDMQEVFGLKKK